MPLLIAQSTAPAQPAAPPQLPTPVPSATAPIEAVPAPFDPVTAERTYEGLTAKRSELRSQLNRVEEKRTSIAQRLRSQDNPVTGADREGLEARLKELDGQIMTLYTQIAQADQAVAAAAAIPGAVEPSGSSNGNEAEAVTAVMIVFTLFVLAPIAIAYARRLWKRGAVVVPPASREMETRLNAMAQAIESIAVETERIGEGQRFLTKVMAEQGRALGAGPAQPIPVPTPAADPLPARESRTS